MITANDLLQSLENMSAEQGECLEDRHRLLLNKAIARLARESERGARELIRKHFEVMRIDTETLKALKDFVSRLEAMSKHAPTYSVRNGLNFGLSMYPDELEIVLSEDNSDRAFIPVNPKPPISASDFPFSEQLLAAIENCNDQDTFIDYFSDVALNHPLYLDIMGEVNNVVANYRDNLGFYGFDYESEDDLDDATAFFYAVFSPLIEDWITVVLDYINKK